MGTMILVSAFVIEAALASYCLMTKSQQPQLRSYLRIGAFGVFVLLAAFAVIQWSFRWYALGALLLSWALLGVWTLLRPQPDQKTFRRGLMLLKAVAIF